MSGSLSHLITMTTDRAGTLQLGVNLPDGLVVSACDNKCRADQKSLVMLVLRNPNCVALIQEVYGEQVPEWEVLWGRMSNIARTS